MIPAPTLLFCPANRGERYGKAAAAAEGVILDLEDAVAPADKIAARETLLAHSETEQPLSPEQVIVRVNPFGTADFALDLAAVRDTPYRTLMLAKTEEVAGLDALGAEGFHVIALCETVLGVETAAAIAAHPQVTGMMWGAEDLIASLGGSSSRHADGSYREVARFARSRVLFAAKAAGVQAIDSVFLNISDLAGLRAETVDAAASGFDAKAAIHPSQAAVIREGFAADPERRTWAEQVLAEAARQPGVFRFAGQMIDEPVLRQARRLLGKEAG